MRSVAAGDTAATGQMPALAEREIAERFQAEGRIIPEPGEELSVE